MHPRSSSSLPIWTYNIIQPSRYSLRSSQGITLNHPSPTMLLGQGEIITSLPSLPDRTGLSPDQIHDLLYTCVSSSCFQFQGKYYEQTAGTSMGSPISPVLADIFMEEFESSSLLFADLRPSLWLRYVDDTIISNLSYYKDISCFCNTSLLLGCYNDFNLSNDSKDS